MIGTVAAWALKEGISRNAAYKRINDHAIPFVSKGKIDFAIADRIWASVVNPAKQRGGVAGGLASGGVGPVEPAEETEMEEEAPPLFSGVARDPQAARLPPSQLGRLQLQREALRVRREQLLIGELEKRLVPLDVVRAYEAQMFAEIRSALLTLGPDLRDDIAAMDQPAKVEALINSKVNLALARLAAWRPTK